MQDNYMQRLRSEWPAVALAAGFVLLVGVAQILSDRFGGWVFMRTNYSAGAWWQLWTSQWVHFGGYHAALNAASLVLLLWAMRGSVAGALQLGAMLGGYIGVAMVLALDPACNYYAGASGALHGFWAGNAVALIVWPLDQCDRRSAWRWLGGLMLGTMLVKFWWQLRVGGGVYLLQVLEPLVGHFDEPQFPVYHSAHFAGAAGGMAAVLLYGLCRRLVVTASTQRPAGEKQ